MICPGKQEIMMDRTSARFAVLFLTCLMIDLTAYRLAAGEIQVEEVVGEIVSLDMTLNVVTIKTRQEEMSLYVNENTQITMGKEEIHFSDLKVGDKVKVHYTEAEGRELAVRIMVRPHRRKGLTKGAFDQ
jgi:hypothetical protein